MPRGEVIKRPGSVKPSYEHLAAPRKGTQCALLSREVLVAASEAGPAVHRLRFAWPSTFEGPPPCCEGGDGVVHVHVRAPAPDGVSPKELLRPYSPTVMDADGFELAVKIYADRQGVSAYLGALKIGAYAHVPEIRAMDYHRDARRVAMICFGVGVTECLPLGMKMLARGAEVRMAVLDRDASRAVLLREFAELEAAYPTSLRVRRYFSRPRPGDLERGYPRVDVAALRDFFGGSWIDGKPADYLEIVGSARHERDAYEMVLAAAIWPTLFIGMGHPPFIIMKGPDGFNAPWQPLSPSEMPPSTYDSVVTAVSAALVVTGLAWFARFVARRRLMSSRKQA